MATRYDIAHSVSRLSQYAGAPTISANKALTRVLQYCLGSVDFSLAGVQQPGAEDKFSFYSDSDHAGDKPFTTKSQTGTMVMLNGVPVHWVSRKQTDYTAYSSAMAEIYALSETVRDSRLLAFRSEEMGLVLNYPLRIHAGG